MLKKMGTRLGLVPFLVVIMMLFMVAFFAPFGNKNECDPYGNYASRLTGPEHYFSMNEILVGPPNQDDPRIQDYIRRNHLFPPSTEEYNLNEPDLEDPSMGQGKKVRELFKNMRNGFFIECGALDGEIHSNTLTLERHYGWKGLLVEADPNNFNLLQKKNRKSWISNSCLAIKPYPQKVLFQQAFNVGKVIADASSVPAADTKGFVEVQCFPLLSLLSAIGQHHIDYFSLDVEGNELAVLRTIPFDKIHIKVLTVEFVHGAEGREVLLDLMSKNNFTSIGEITHPLSYVNDFVFVHNSMYKKGMEFATIRQDDSVGTRLLEAGKWEVN